MVDLLSAPTLIDPEPRSTGGLDDADPIHFDDAALNTIDWDGPGNLRVSYVLPSMEWSVHLSGVFWPRSNDSNAALFEAVGPHRLVWAETSLKRD